MHVNSFTLDESTWDIRLWFFIFNGHESCWFYVDIGSDSLGKQVIIPFSWFVSGCPSLLEYWRRCPPFGGLFLFKGCMHSDWIGLFRRLPQRDIQSLCFELSLHKCSKVTAYSISCKLCHRASWGGPANCISTCLCFHPPVGNDFTRCNYYEN